MQMSIIFLPYYIFIPKLNFSEIFLMQILRLKFLFELLSDFEQNRKTYLIPNIFHMELRNSNDIGTQTRQQYDNYVLFSLLIRRTIFFSQLLF